MMIIKHQKPLRQIFRWMWTIAKGNRLQTILNAIVGICEVATSLWAVYAIRYAIDVASHQTEGSLLWAVAFMGMLILLEFAFSISAVWIRNILGVRAQNQMQERMLERVLRSEWQGTRVRHSGDIMNRLEDDVKTVVNFLAETLPMALSTLLLFVGAFAYLFMLDRTLALITIAVVPLCVVLSKFYVFKMRRLNRSVRDSDSKIQSVMQEVVQNLMVIKTLESGDAMVGKLAEQHSVLRQNVVRRTFFSLMSNLTMNLGFAISYLIAFGWSAVRLSAGTLTFGGMTAFLQLVNKIQTPARSLARLLPQAVSVFTAAERLMEIEDVPEEGKDDPVMLTAPCSIHFDHVSFSYADGSTPVFSDFSHTFKAGTSTAVVGETGAGKTTLFRLLLALAHPTSGRVSIKGAKCPPHLFGCKECVEKKCGTQRLSHLHRCNFVYVPQGNTLMSGSIRDNLLMGKPDATETEMRDALTMSCAEFVYSLPDALDTMCSEQGGGLSEGQAQRIAIARALLRNRPVMLFDEATSALDPDTERRLLQNVLQDKSRTVIFITHRLAVCDYCDDVLRL